MRYVIWAAISHGHIKIKKQITTVGSHGCIIKLIEIQWCNNIYFYCLQINMFGDKISSFFITKNENIFNVFNG